MDRTTCVWYRPLRPAHYDGERRLPATIIREGAVRVRVEVQCPDGSRVRASVSRQRLEPRDVPTDEVSAPQPAYDDEVA